MENMAFLLWDLSFFFGGKLCKQTAFRTRLQQQSREQRTQSLMYLRQAAESRRMNSTSSSLSVYHGPPVSSIDGSRCASM